MTELSTATQEVFFDHPSQKGWWDGAAREEAAAARDAILRDRFKEFEIGTVEKLVGGVSLACAFSDSYRVHHETETLGHLNLTDEQLEEYQRLSGKPETVGEFVGWFAAVSNSLFEVAIPRKEDGSAQKIGLEIGGDRQHGVRWRNPGLDTLKCAVSNIILQQEGCVGFQAYRSRPDVPDSFKFKPLGAVTGRAWDQNFLHGVLECRWPVMDVYFTQEVKDDDAKELPRIHIFEQANSLVVVDNLDKKDLEFIRRAYAKNEKLAENLVINGRRNSEVAARVKRAYVGAAQPDVGEKSHVILPISRQFVMQTDGHAPRQMPTS